LAQELLAGSVVICTFVPAHKLLFMSALLAAKVTEVANKGAAKRTAHKTVNFPLSLVIIPRVGQTLLWIALSQLLPTLQAHK
jgi:hypothetical protein